jgi:hypothetical protein
MEASLYTPSTTPNTNGFGALRTVLESARGKAGCGLSDLTVLSAQVDPYRLDTPSGHRDGQWLAKQLNRAIGKKRRIHWRGLHYALVARGNVVKPNGETFQNTDDDWTWLANVAGSDIQVLTRLDFPIAVSGDDYDEAAIARAFAMPSQSVH